MQADIQIYRPTVRETCRHTDIRKYRHTSMQKHKCPDIQVTYRHTDIRRDTDAQIYRYTHTDRQTDRQTGRQAGRQAGR